MYIKRSGADKKVRDEKELRRQTRRQLDTMSGLTRSKGAMRADYKLCRENDKLYNDYRAFKNPKDRERIKTAYFNEQKKWQNLERGG